MNEKLKPCPFCGGEADCNDKGICDKDGNSLWWVECLGCGVSTNGHLYISEAMKTWNRRDGDKEKDSRIEALESWLRIAGTYACDCCVGCQALGLNNAETENCLSNNGKNWIFDWERFIPSKEDEKLPAK